MAFSRSSGHKRFSAFPQNFRKLPRTAQFSVPSSSSVANSARLSVASASPILEGRVFIFRRKLATNPSSDPRGAKRPAPTHKSAEKKTPVTNNAPKKHKKQNPSVYILSHSRTP